MTYKRLRLSRPSRAGIFRVNLCAMHKFRSKIMQPGIGKEIAGNINDVCFVANSVLVHCEF